MLREYLEDGRESIVPLAELARAWKTTRIQVLCTTPPVFGVELGGRIRGALGQQLRGAASDGAVKKGRCEWRAPCAYDVFFNSQGNVTPRLEIPKPWALSIQQSEHGLSIELKIFGIAGNWSGEIAEALVRALRGGISDGRGKRPALKVVGRDIVVEEGCPPPATAEGPMLLEFYTPLMLRRGNETHHETGSLLKTIGNRVNGLARWHGHSLGLEPQSFVEEVAHLAEGAEWLALRPNRWQSHSSRQRRIKPMSGVCGTLALPAPGPQMRLLLALGSHAQAGAHTTHGLGAYQLSALPAI